LGVFGGSGGNNARTEIVGLLNDIKASIAGGSGGTVDLSGVNTKLDRIIAELHTP
jgi:hypothetical protein